jgi:hypothetical protein
MTAKLSTIITTTLITLLVCAWCDREAGVKEVRTYCETQLRLQRIQPGPVYDRAQRLCLRTEGLRMGITQTEIDGLE